MIKLLRISKTLCDVSNHSKKKMYLPYITDRTILFASIYFSVYRYKSHVFRSYINYVQDQCGHAYCMHRYVCTRPSSPLSRTVHIQLYCYPTSFPHGPCHKRSSTAVLGQVILFLLCYEPSCNNCFHLATIFKSVTIKILIPRCKWMVIARGRIPDIGKVYCCTGLWQQRLSLKTLTVCNVSFVCIKNLPRYVAGTGQSLKRSVLNFTFST